MMWLYCENKLKYEKARNSKWQQCTIVVTDQYVVQVPFYILKI